MRPVQPQGVSQVGNASTTVLVGPIRLRQATMACPYCDTLTPVHALLVAAVVGSAGFRAAGPMLVSGLPELPPEASERLSLLAPGLVLPQDGREHPRCYLNRCSSCLRLLPEELLYEVEDAPFRGLPASRHPSDVILQTRDLSVQSAILRA